MKIASARSCSSVLQARRAVTWLLLGTFERLVKLDQPGTRPRSRAHGPLPADLQIELQAGLSKMCTVRGISTLFAHNPALIGGMRIKVGSDVYDGSVRAGLAALEKSFGITSANGRNVLT